MMEPKIGVMNVMEKHANTLLDKLSSFSLY